MDFRWYGGRLSLDFVATLSKRHTERIERLPDPPALQRWLRQAGLPGDDEASARDLADAKELREALFGLFTAFGTDLDVVNRWATRPVPGAWLECVGDELRLVRPVMDVRDRLSLVAKDGVDLLTGSLADRVRMCADEECTLLFVDESRAGGRRWCSMDACGARSKMARYRAPRT